ncbi:Protein CBG25420 [Caenorhabditis briggsae]|uniref:Uncharacterized protein n=2 Tax=Caenorhabditis briggsae TaxID=6238 RepID=A0AAE9E6T4_CAEBR|nr:Protein CBG25420 [Caenorhabditis briggsae]UMM14916.1 hypothetical protein L5515_002549 [Caenorhabditis briggsae]CAS00195.1 Protein CBG25420 [Caenorhabditis briggsae]
MANSQKSKKSGKVKIWTSKVYPVYAGQPLPDIPMGPTSSSEWNSLSRCDKTIIITAIILRLIAFSIVAFIYVSHADNSKNQ